MRLLAVLVAVAGMAACEPDAPPAPDPAAYTGPEPSALNEAAEKTCAEMTGYASQKLAGMSSEMRTLVTREYNDCVAKVGRPAP